MVLRGRAARWRGAPPASGGAADHAEGESEHGYGEEYPERIIEVPVDRVAHLPVHEEARIDPVTVHGLGKPGGDLALKALRDLAELRGRGCRRASSSSRDEVGPASSMQIESGREVPLRSPGRSPGPCATRLSSLLLLHERLDAFARCAAGNEAFHETCPQYGWGPSLPQTLDGALDALFDGAGA